MSELQPIKRALISVSDKSNLEQLAVELHELGVEIISTGGTLKKLKDFGVPSVSVSSFTGEPEILGGRVKTLHPKVYAGLLYRRDNPDDVELLGEMDYRAIDLVIVNLYPFEKTLAKDDSTDADLIENIDIGGPSMIRASAKNHHAVTVVVDPTDYTELIAQLKKNEGGTDFDFRRRLAAKAFTHTAHYDSIISGYFVSGKKPTNVGDFGQTLSADYILKQTLRYGENPHQKAALYAKDNFSGPTLVNAEILSGKELSYNNYADLDSVLDMLLEFDQPFAVVVKHANPCGAAIGETIAEAYQKAYDSDPLSAFGSIIGLNRKVDMACAEKLHETPFVECIVAPSFDDDAFKMLKKKKSRRLLALPSMTAPVAPDHKTFKQIRGGLLYQDADQHKLDPASLKTVTNREATESELADMLFAWKIVKHTKSNAIVLAKDGATVGVGMGQTSRVDAGFIAVKRAGDRAKGAVMASDAFFPMPDGVEVATDVGVTAIIQPGGSKGDEQAIEAADKAKAAMVFTSVRHFKH